jgi:phenylacetate-coenzyme A ligase PaaK-like adenylate-forming protein
MPTIRCPIIERQWIGWVSDRLTSSARRICRSSLSSNERNPNASRKPLCLERSPLQHCLALRSGGSTGVPCTIYHDTAALFQNAAHGERDRTMITTQVGTSFGYRETVVAAPTGADKRVQEFCQTRGFFPPSFLIKRQYLSVFDPPEINLGLINEFQPDVIHSYGSYLGVLFPYLHDTGRPFSRPKCVTYSSDGLSPAVRRLIVEAFGLPVLSTYEAGSAENRL